MSNDKAKQFKQLESIIGNAIKKVSVKHENELCKYIPLDSGGYIHHFTLKKMKKKEPEELGSLIEKHIINNPKPKVIPPKKRAPRGSRKSRELLQFSKAHLDRLLNIARMAGDKEMIALLAPRKSLAACKRDLINAIRNNETNQELWTQYVEAVEQREALQKTFA